jgi:beta-ketoacyl-acyl-carrier-protein synthase II
MADYALNNDQAGRRVVITGMGVVAPNGSDLASFWESIVKGVSAAAPVTRFDTSAFPTKIGCEVKGFDPRQHMDFKKAKRFELSIQYGIAASRLAVKDAGIDFTKMDPDRVGVVEGTSLSATESSLKGQATLLSRGYTHMSPFALINGHFGGGSGEIALELGVKGYAVTYSSGSASGNDAIGYARSMIQDDDVDVVVAGGAEAPFIPALWGIFCLTKVMTTRNDNPQGAMRPLDKAHDGFLLGEGSGFLVLEELSHALARGAKIYAELAGYGRSCEAYHSVAPHPDGLGMRRAMEKALRKARLHPSEINYINIHGTATSTYDRVEISAIKSLFGAHAPQVAVSATKPITGHLLAAAGAIETIICALAVKNREIPFTLNLKNPDEGCDGDLVSGQSRPYPLHAVMNVNCGFGGKNACLILKEYPERP